MSPGADVPHPTHHPSSTLRLGTPLSCRLEVRIALDLSHERRKLVRHSGVSVLRDLLDEVVGPPVSGRARAQAGVSLDALPG